MKGHLLLTVLLCVACFGISDATAGPPFPLKKSLKFNSNSPYALVVFESEPQSKVATWSLGFYAYSLDSQSWTYGPLNGWGRFGDLKARASGRQFHAALVKPAGTYVINSIRSQGSWRACLNSGTRAFTVEPGKINYIGVIDPNPALEQLVSGLPGVSKNGQIHYLFDLPRLTHVPASLRTNWYVDVQSYITENFPKVSASIIAVEPVDVVFDTAISPFGSKICEKY